MMPRKTYEALAEALRRSRPDNPKRVSYPQWQMDVLFVAGVLRRDNPKFDTQRFMSAAGASDEVAS